jgi:vacuolar-type H+-ATPase subunit H
MSERPNEPQQLLESLLSTDEQDVQDTTARPAQASTPVNEEYEDVDALIDELEVMFTEAKRVPFGRRLLIDEAQALEMVDRLRSAFPGEVRQAHRVLDEQERILGEARKRAHNMLNERGLMAELEVERERMLAKAESEIEQMRAEADAYVRGVLTGLEERLTKIQASVRNGIEALDPPQEQS